MKNNKALFILNIITFVLLVACLVFNAIIVIDVAQIKDFIANNPDADVGEQLGNGIGLALLVVFQALLIIPYGVCLILSVVSAIKKYFNWLSIANMAMCFVGAVLTVFVLLYV